MLLREEDKLLSSSHLVVANLLTWTGGQRRRLTSSIYYIVIIIIIGCYYRVVGGVDEDIRGIGKENPKLRSLSSSGVVSSLSGPKIIQPPKSEGNF